MFDLPKFISGLHDFIARAIAPIQARVDGIVKDVAKVEKELSDFASDTTDSIADLRKNLEAASASMTADEVKALIDAAKPDVIPDRPTKDDVAKMIGDAFAEAIIEGSGALASKEFVEGRIHGAFQDAAAQMEDIARGVLPQKDTSLEEAVQKLDEGFDGRVLAIVGADDSLLRAVDLEKAIAALPLAPSADSIRDAVLAAMPEPKQGDKGEDGKSFTIEEVRALVTGAIEEVSARYMLDFERRATDTLRSVIDAMPKPKDGLDLRNFSVRQEKGGREIVLALSDGERSEEFRLSYPVVLDRGYYQQGKSYEQGDGVTSQGCYWIAQEDTDLAPGDNAAWRKAVNKGRDSRGLPAGDRKPLGPVKVQS